MSGCAPEPARCPRCGGVNTLDCTTTEDRQADFLKVHWCRDCHEAWGVPRVEEVSRDPTDGPCDFPPGDPRKVRLMCERRKRREAVCHSAEFARAAPRISRMLVLIAEQAATDRKATVAFRLQELRRKAGGE